METITEPSKVRISLCLFLAYFPHRELPVPKWAIPEMALQPLNLFPASLLFTVIAVGLLDSIPAVLLGAWIYRR